MVDLKIISFKLIFNIFKEKTFAFIKNRSKFNVTLKLYQLSLQVPLEDLHWASQQLMEALHIRERYMRVSHQSFPTITSRFFHKKHPQTHDDPSSPSSGTASVLRSSDSATDVTAAGGDNKSEIRQPYPSARVIKHEDRQSIAGKFENNRIIIIEEKTCVVIDILSFYNKIE